MTTARTWLAATLTGPLAALPSPPPELELDALLALAQHEGVLSLVSWRWQQARLAGAENLAVPEAVCQAFAAAARAEALTSMLLESQARAVLAALDGLNSPSLLLKGSALAYWAYPQAHLRTCSDVDVLVPTRADAEQLAGQLSRVGYERAHTSGDLVAYELMCSQRIGAGLRFEIDVHWRLANSPLFADVFTFDELMADSIALPRLGPEARGLGPVHACLHACIHRALNLSIGIDDKLKWLYDLELLAAEFGPTEWQKLTVLASSKGLAGVVLQGLQAASVAFGRVLPDEVCADLTQAQAQESLDARRLSDWWYVQHQTFLIWPTFKLRLRWLSQRLFPSRDYLAHLYGAKHRNYLFLMVLRLGRALRRVRR